MEYVGLQKRVQCEGGLRFFMVDLPIKRICRPICVTIAGNFPPASSTAVLRRDHITKDKMGCRNMLLVRSVVNVGDTTAIQAGKAKLLYIIVSHRSVGKR